MLGFLYPTCSVGFRTMMCVCLTRFCNFWSIGKPQRLLIKNSKKKDFSSIKLCFGLGFFPMTQKMNAPEGNTSNALLVSPLQATCTKNCKNQHLFDLLHYSKWSHCPKIIRHPDFQLQKIHRYRMCNYRMND